jgi:large subunit ribosomal protein L15
MKLHDIQPAEGSRTPRTRVGRGIAAGKGKTAGRGTKGQKARAGGSIPPWFEGGQTPLHMRIPKLRGFKNRFKIHYEVVNVGAIGELAERGAFEVEAPAGKSARSAPITINQDILRAVGLVRTLDKPMKVLGAGELSTPLFVVADAFTASARAKIEAAGGSVNVLEVPTSPLAALGVTAEHEAASAAPAEAPAADAEPAPAVPDDEPPAKPARRAAKAAARGTAEVDAKEDTADAGEAPVAEAPASDAPGAKRSRKGGAKAAAAGEPGEAEATASGTGDDEPSAVDAAEPPSDDDA